MNLKAQKSMLARPRERPSDGKVIGGGRVVVGERAAAGEDGGAGGRSDEQFSLCMGFVRVIGEVSTFAKKTTTMVMNECNFYFIYCVSLN